MLTSALRQQLALTTSSTIADVLDGHGLRGYMSAALKAIGPCKIVGEAVPVLKVPTAASVPDTPMHELLGGLPAGSVVVVGCSEPAECALWGGLMAVAAKQRGAVGAVVDGYVRDAQEVLAEEFWIFARGTSPGTSRGRLRTVRPEAGVTCGGILVNPGDIIVGDTDGVAAIPRDLVQEVAAQALALDQRDRRVADLLRQGVSVPEAFRLRQ
ncbi:MAG: RraA family protein [candidate division NC10 bacterium]|nr:RraA family protein [candidate division NC10 bacterium]